MAKGLTCSILQPLDIGNCSNHGISSRVTSVVLLPSEDVPDIPGIFEPRDNCPAVVIRKRVIGAKTYYHAVPVEALDSDIWYMMGGCFISTPDSRFPFDYPIPLHDRVER